MERGGCANSEFEPREPDEQALKMSANNATVSLGPCLIRVVSENLRFKEWAWCRERFTR